MRISVSKIISIVAIAAVAVLGVDYVGSAAGHNANPLTVNANIAHVYSVSDTGGSGQKLYNLPALQGNYAASFSANFFPQGTPSAPVSFSCFLLKNNNMRAQDTSVSTYSGGFYIGVNGVNTVHVTTSDVLQVGCGIQSGAWSWGTRPLQVTLTNVDGFQNFPLSGPAKSATLHAEHASTGTSAR
jgi:hypothetical protein